MQPSANIDYFQLPHIYFSDSNTVGDRLIIMGESTRGEYYDPKPISNLELALAYFGDSPLTDRYKDAIAGGMSLVYLMRIEPNAFQTAWDYLIKFPFDLIYMDGFNFIEMPELIHSFIEFAKEKEYMGQLIHGFIDAGTSSMEEITPYFENIRELSVETSNGIEELGKYISIVMSHVKGHKAAALYAGKVTDLDPQISPVNKTFDVELVVEYANDEMKLLDEVGVVCFKKTLKKGVVCAISSCAVATEGSAHKHIANFRIAQSLIQDLSAQQELLVGRVGYAPVIEDLNEIARTTLNRYMQLARIKSGSYQVRVDWPKLITEVEIVPVFSVYSITSTAQVRVRR